MAKYLLIAVLQTATNLEYHLADFGPFNPMDRSDCEYLRPVVERGALYGHRDRGVIYVQAWCVPWDSGFDILEAPE